MKHSALLLLLALLADSPPACATPTLTFTGGNYEIQVGISDTSDEISDLRLYDGDHVVLVAAREDLAEARYNPAGHTLSLVVPAKGNVPKLVLVAHGKKATMEYGAKRVKLSCDGPDDDPGRIRRYNNRPTASLNRASTSSPAARTTSIGPAPKGLQRCSKRGQGAPAKTVTSGTPQAAATCWPAES